MQCDEIWHQPKINGLHRNLKNC